MVLWAGCKRGGYSFAALRHGRSWAGAQDTVHVHVHVHACVVRRHNPNPNPTLTLTLTLTLTPTLTLTVTLTLSRCGAPARVGGRRARRGGACTDQTKPSPRLFPLFPAQALALGLTLSWLQT